MKVFETWTVAAIQAAPVFFDREASTEKACKLIKEASATGACMAVFSEAWIPGYAFFQRSAPTPLWWKAVTEYVDQAVEIPSKSTNQLCEAARHAKIDVVIGIVERDSITKGTLYCTLLFISHEGKILGRHRKLKPTQGERRIWGDGDAQGLKVYDREYGKISGLNCWEHNMVLPGYALMAQGTQIHVAAWPGCEMESPPESPNPLWPRQTLLSRAFASQGACYVILASGLCLPEHVPERYRELCTFPYSGESCIIDPRGEIISGPAQGETIITAKVTLEDIYAAKVACDSAGHYSRPDLLKLYLSGQPIFSNRAADPKEEIISTDNDPTDSFASRSDENSAS